VNSSVPIRVSIFCGWLWLVVAAGLLDLAS
jgi:hypothetical protein